MSPEGRMQFEKDTIRKMIVLYCRKQHGSNNTQLCAECMDMLSYAIQRIDACRFAPLKPACSACSVHCFRKDMREKIRHIMRFSGPRMLWHFPFTTIRYMRIKHTIRN